MLCQRRSASCRFADSFHHELDRLAGVARNALWILGLSIVLASWSYTSWWASMRRIKVRHALGLPRFQTPFAVGLTLFCASLAWGSTRWWERGLWIVLGCLSCGSGDGRAWAAGMDGISPG
jgi:hypothetical protein